MPEQEYSKKISIVVFGTDPKGEMFQEDTSTIVVARTWTTIRLRHSLQSGSDVIVFNKENGNQAEFVLDSVTAPNEAKLALRDHSLDMWQLDFGVPPEPVPDLRTKLHLVCTRCGTRESAPVEDHELAKLERTGAIVRYCSQCLSDGEWQNESAVERAAGVPAMAEPVAMPEPPPAAPASEQAPWPPVSPADTQVSPPPPAPGAEEAVPVLSGAERRVSRRIQLKTRARIRRANSTETVQPVNVSRGGICFESRSSYELDEVIWVAMHYREGGEALETPSRIIRITRPETGCFAYGVRFEL